jgi:hypothetical protein
MAETRAGGCLCGAVRYTVQWPPAAVATCSCKNCQRQAGSALSLLAVVPRAALEIKGELKTFVDTADSGNAVERQFCPSCGSPIISDMQSARDQGIIFLKAGTLDEARDLVPTLHYWTSSAHGWIVFPEGSTKIAQQ